MRRLDPIALELNVDLLEAVPGPQDVQLIEDYVDGVPRGVEVEFIDPEWLSIDVETREW